MNSKYILQYDDTCFLLKQCFRDNPDKKLDRKRVVEVSVVNIMKYHTFFGKLSSQFVREFLKTFFLIKLG